MITLEGR